MKINLITGMFKMELADIFVIQDTVAISTPDNERRIPLAHIENISITRHTDRNPRFEISLNNEMIEGVFVQKSDADAFADSLKECMGSVLQINFYGQ